MKAGNKRSHHQQTSLSPSNSEQLKQFIVRNCQSYVEADIQHVLRQSPFLQQSEPNAHIALFHRSEIVAGTRLGKGGFSYVYEIVDFILHPQYDAMLSPAQQSLREYYRDQTRSGHGRYAIKHLQERLLKEPKAYQCAASDLAVEAAYMSALDHPNVVSVRGLPIHGLDALSEGRHDGYFLILDRLEETLDKRIESWKRNEDMPILGKAGYALQLAGALRYLHDHGILFRDLKPQNLGFNFDGRLQLLDFGLCREMPRMTGEEVYEMSGVGTRRYMAVEIVNTSCYNDKADVYSWAMVFWEMLSRSKPFATHTVDDHKRFVCEGGERPPLSTKWPQALQNLLVHSWATSITDRLSMREVECLLKSYIECCKMLDEDIPDSSILTTENRGQEARGDDLVLWRKDLCDERDGAIHARLTTCQINVTKQQSVLNAAEAADALLLRDPRMSCTLRDLSSSFSLQSSVFGEHTAAGNSAITAASTVVSDAESLGSGFVGLGRNASF